MNDIYIILTKLLHIFLSGIFIMTIGILISKKLNDIYPENKRNKKKTYKLIIDFCVFTGLIYISHYFIRNFMEVINKNLFSYIFQLYEMVLYLVGHNFVHCAVHQYISLIHFYHIGQAGH